MIDVLALPGTGWPNGGDGVTESFLAQLDARKFNTRIVTYPATFGDRQGPYGESRDAGMRALITATRDADNPVILAGYSQGAVIAGDLALRVHRGDFPDLELAGVALIADGLRPIGAGPAPGYGIAGQRAIPDDLWPVFWAAVHNDPITALPAGNPLRTIADLVEWYSIRSPEDSVRWGASMLDAVARGRLQDWWNPSKWSGWSTGLAYARGYLFDKRHTNAYIDEGHTRALADAITSAV